MRKLLTFFVCSVMCGAAFATGENVATSKAFVDAGVAQKQNIIPANNGAPQVLTNTGTPGAVGTKNIYDSNASYSAQTDALVTAGDFNTAVQNAIDTEFECIAWNPNDSTDCWLVQIRSASPNRLPAPENQTKTLNGVTVTVNNGMYSFNGVATADTYFEFELTRDYQFPTSVYYGGRGGMYLWNNKRFSDGNCGRGFGNTVSLAWLTPNKGFIDCWRFTKENRQTFTYVNQTGYIVKYVRIYIDANTDMSGFSFAPMFVEDGVTTYTTFFPYYNPNNFIPSVN